MPRCKSCQQEIKFSRTAKNKRLMPVDVPAITVVTNLGHVIKAFTPHWGNCSSGERFRKKSTDGE